MKNFTFFYTGDSWKRINMFSNYSSWSTVGGSCDLTNGAESTQLSTLRVTSSWARHLDGIGKQLGVRGCERERVTTENNLTPQTADDRALVRTPRDVTWTSSAVYSLLSFTTTNNNFRTLCVVSRSTWKLTGSTYMTDGEDRLCLRIFGLTKTVNNV